MCVVSVIVPIYNAENFIYRCVNSILMQTLKELQIILINDGSTDNTKKIIEQFADQDSRIVLINQINSGVSVARNKGLEMAHGEFVAFVDADDWIESNMLEDLYRHANMNHSDLTICNVIVYESNTIPYRRLEFSDGNYSLNQSRDYFFRELMSFKYDNANWNKLYRNSIIKKNKLNFSVQMTLWEDLLFNLQYSIWAEKVTFVDKSLYNYSIHGEGLSSGSCLKMIVQFNLLYSEFVTYCKKVGNAHILDRFKFEMVRMANFGLINQIEYLTMKENENVWNRIFIYQWNLKLLDQNVFQTPLLNKSKWINFKSYLLSHRIVWAHVIQFGITRSFVKL